MYSVCHKSQGPGQRGGALLPLHRGRRGWTSVTACTTGSRLGSEWEDDGSGPSAVWGVHENLFARIQKKKNVCKVTRTLRY